MIDGRPWNDKGQRGIGMKVIIVILSVLNICFFCIGEEEKNAKEVLNDFSLVQYKDGGAEKWKVNGKTAHVEDDSVSIDNISAISLGEGTILKLKAKKGSFNKENKVMNLDHNVIAATSNGMRLVTDYLVWDTENKNMSTDGLINIRKADFEVNGRGAVCDLEGNTAELKEQVTLSMKPSNVNILDGTGEGADVLGPPAGGRTIITCDGPLELNYSTNRAIFHNNVKVEDSHGNIFADNMDVYFTKDTRRIKCVVARGNVKIINGGNITYSDKAIYLVSEGRVVFPHRPKLVINSDNKSTN